MIYPTTVPVSAQQTDMKAQKHEPDLLIVNFTHKMTTMTQISTYQIRSRNGTHWRYDAKMYTIKP